MLETIISTVLLAILSGIGFLIKYYFFSERKQTVSPQVPEVTSPSPQVPEVTSPSPQVPEVTSPSPQVPEVTSPSPQVPEEGAPNMDIDELRRTIKILFIDDDTEFETATMLKNSGWENINIIKDCNNLNASEITNTDIFFIDIHGVGIKLGFKEHGLGLAQAIKKKYPGKKVVIYSSERHWDSFHPAWNIADDRLHKDADTYQFENVIENLLLD